MIKFDFNIPIYGVDVKLIQVESALDAKPVSRILSKITSKENIESVVDDIKSEYTNGGNTFRNLYDRKFILIFLPITSEETRAEIYSHEKRHIEDRMLEFFEVSDSESCALLAGFLGIQFYKFNNLVHDKIRSKNSAGFSKS